MSFDYITSERLDGVAVITLNRPEKLNALSFGLMQELDDELTRIESNDEINAVVLTGAGERAFSAGADIHEMAAMNAEDLEERYPGVPGLNLTWEVLQSQETRADKARSRPILEAQVVDF